MILRAATPDDVPYLAGACIMVARFMRRGETDPFIAGFPDQVDAGILNWAGAYVQSPRKIACLAESSDGSRIGCIFGSIEPSSLPMAVADAVGTIAVCWVEPGHRRAGVARALLGEIETWFRSRRVRHLEVAYMAKNETASEAWTHLGFSPFRVFAYKEIGGNDD